MPRETKAQRTSRVSTLCASYDAHRRELAKLTKIVNAEKELVKVEDPGTYGEWIIATGTAREINDMEAIKAHYADRGETLPTRMSEPPVVVSPAVGK